MTPETNLIALAMVLDSADAAVEPADFPYQWQSDTWEMVRAGAGLAEVFARLGGPQCNELTTAVDELPPIRRRRDLRALAAVVKGNAIDRRVRLICEKNHGASLVQALSEAVIAPDMQLDESESVHVRDVMADIIGHAEAIRAGTAQVEMGIPSGIGCLDRRLTFGGLKRGVVTVLAGASSSGKSALAKTFVLGAIAGAKKVLWGTFEDSATSACNRMIADRSGLENRQLQQGVVHGRDWRDFLAAASGIANADIWLCDAPPASVDALCRKVRREVRAHKIDLVVIDFLQLLTLGRRAESKTVEVTQVAQAIQRMSRQMPDTATLLVSQLRRRGDAMPTKEDLRWSGEIEQLAHTIGLLWRPDTGAPGHIALNIDKQKDGPTGLLALAWNPETVSYRAPDPHEAEAYLTSIRKGIE
jgi:replicative DNA helicase